MMAFSLTNVLSKGDKILVLESGRFAVGWGDSARRMGVEVEILPGDLRRAVRPEEVEARLKADKEGRIMVVMVHNTDLPDPWEREGEDKDYFYRFSPDAYAVGIDIMLYAMSH